MFTYSHTCPACGETFEQSRKKPYKKVRVSKTCPSCKDTDKDTRLAEEFGGRSKDQRCGSCVHFGVDVNRPVNQYWRGCGQGKFSADGEGALVYFLDLCEEFEAYEDD